MKKHITDLQKLSTTELLTTLVDLKAEIVELRRGVILGDVQNNQLVTQKRRQVARVKMLLARPKAENLNSDVVVETKKVVKKTTAKEKK